MGILKLHYLEVMTMKVVCEVLITKEDLSPDHICTEETKNIIKLIEDQLKRKRPVMEFEFNDIQMLVLAKSYVHILDTIDIGPFHRIFMMRTLDAMKEIVIDEHAKPLN